MTSLEILELVLLCICILALSIYVLIKGIKNKWFAKLLATIETSIKEAEKKFPESGCGDKKKMYVIDAVKAKCKELGIPYDILKKLINVAIDKVIEDYNIISK